ncbi:MAG TPA: hypothetical protein VHO50_07145 [Bacteroidales bacterium]|nr:hypothetical protein [Bacteroidales bacterium]
METKKIKTDGDTQLSISRAKSYSDNGNTQIRIPDRIVLLAQNESHEEPIALHVILTQKQTKALINELIEVLHPNESSF